MTTSQRLRKRWTGRVAASLLLVATLLFGQAFLATGPLSAPEVEAQTQQTDGCHYRQGGLLDSSLCWIELDGVNTTTAASAAGQRMSIRLNANYTINFTVKYNLGTGGGARTIDTAAVPTWPGAVFGNTLGGTTYYRAPTGVPASTPLSFYTRHGSVNNPSVELRNITVTSSTGAPSSAYGLVMAEAESTNDNEWLTFLSDTGVSTLDKFTPPNYRAACGTGPSSTTGSGGPNNSIPMSGLRCNGISGNAGMILTSTINPTNVKVELGGVNRQGVALAVLMGGATGSVSTDHAAEQGITPKTQFNLEANYADRVLDTDTTTDTTSGQIEGNFLLRGQSGTLTFRSTPTINQTLTWQRYQPTWTCQVTGANGQSNSVNPTVTRTGNTSQATVTINAGQTANCDIRWASRISLTSSLDLGKLVTGDAAGYDDLAGERFTIAYQCTAPAGFTNAYPGTTAPTPLSGQVQLTAGQRQTLPNLPVGANCTIRETQAYTDPSVDLTTGWTNTTTPPGTVTEAATRTLTLVTGRNIVSAVNQYDPVMGDLTVVKGLDGTARAEFRDDTFLMEYRCQDDAPGEWNDVEISAVGDDDTGTVTITDAVPVGRDCEIRETDPPTMENTELTTGIAVGDDDAVEVAAGEAVGFSAPVPATAGGDSSLTITVTNTYDWTSVEVSLAGAKLGSARDVYTGDFDYAVVCSLDDTEVFSDILTVPAADIADGYRVDGDRIVPTGAGTVNPTGFEVAPGALCEVTLTGAAAQARAELAATGEQVRNREPYTYFLDSDGQVRVSTDGTDGDGATSMTTDGVEVDGDGTVRVPGDPIDAWKTHSFTFVVPAPDGPLNGPVYRVSAAHVYPVDARDVTVTKQVAPEDYDAGDFAFTWVCGPAGDPAVSGETTVGDGDSFVLEQVPVNTECSVVESLGDDPAGPAVTWATDAAGTTRLGDLEVVTTADTSTATFTVLPVVDPADVDPGDENWSVTVTNTYAALEITKTIAGGLVSEGGTAPLDTAVLAPGSDSMTVTYTVTNTGGLAFENMAIRDASLAGYVLRTPGGQPVTVEADGTLSGLACGVGEPLLPGATITCEVVVELPGEGTLTYRDTATAVGYTPVVDSRPLQAEDTDAFGALRLQLAGLRLPDTGSQTMVAVLGLGLLVSTVALIGYLRNRGKDE